MRYLLGILNSKYAAVLLSNFRGGDYHIYPEHLRNLPIPLIKLEKQHPIITLVTQIIFDKYTNPLSNTLALEKQIDQLVYKLYNVTEDEINVIES